MGIPDTSYDALNRPTAIKELGSISLASYAYDDLSRRTTVTLGVIRVRFQFLFATPNTSSCIFLSMLGNEKPLEWISSSHKDLMALPADVRRLFGFALSLAQAGDKHDAAKVLKGFGGAGVLEVVEDDIGGTYRARYTVKFAEAVFVLHCFQKKSKRGITTPKEHMDIIHARLKIAETFAKEWRK